MTKILIAMCLLAASVLAEAPAGPIRQGDMLLCWTNWYSHYWNDVVGTPDVLKSKLPEQMAGVWAFAAAPMSDSDIVVFSITLQNKDSGETTVITRVGEKSGQRATVLVTMPAAEFGAYTVTRVKATRHEQRSEITLE